MSDKNLNEVRNDDFGDAIRREMESNLDFAAAVAAGCELVFGPWRKKEGEDTYFCDVATRYPISIVRRPDGAVYAVYELRAGEVLRRG